MSGQLGNARPWQRKRSSALWQERQNLVFVVTSVEQQQRMQDVLTKSATQRPSNAPDISIKKGLRGARQMC
eukprot:1224571-Amphidinium_carterae.1